MAYSDKFNEELKLDIMSEAQELLVQMFMKNGELLFRERLIKSLEKEVARYLDEVDGEPNMEWVDGVRYVIHIVREGSFDE